MADWIRKCDECGHKQKSKPPAEYKSEAWRNVKCRKCGSMGLDYGHEDLGEEDKMDWAE